MNEIIFAPLARMRKEQHLGLMTQTDHLLMSETLAKLGVEAQYPAFSNALAVEKAAISIEVGNINTAKMEDRDFEREDLITGFNHLIENKLRHFNPAIRETAEIVKRVIDKYGNPRYKTNADETVSIHSMTAELLNADNLPRLTALSDECVEWVSQIQTVNEEYNALYELRNAETNGTHVATSLEAREVMDPCYNAIVKRINALALINGDANYSSFINQLNGFIEDYKTTISMQQAARKKQTTPAE